MAMTFVGANSDFVNVGQASVFNLLPQGSEYTLSVWAKTTTASDSGTFICRGNGTTKQYQFTYGSPGPPSELQAQIGGTFYSTGAKGANGLWHHCVLTNTNVSGTYRFQMYHDGATAGTSQASGASTVVTDTLIGARRNTGNTGSGFLFTGTLGDVRIYNRSLSTSEIYSIYYTRGHDNIIQSLIGRWLMNESAPGTTCTGTNPVRDYSDQRNDGTPSGSPTYAADVLTFKRKFFV